jgi:hypothetical protein
MNITGWPVMAHRCSSCPFNDDGDMEVRNAVMGRTILRASQVCHHPRLYGKKESMLCRGARDEQLTILYRLGMLDEPTDEAFRVASEKYARESDVHTA